MKFGTFSCDGPEDKLSKICIDWPWGKCFIEQFRDQANITHRMFLFSCKMQERIYIFFIYILRL